MATEIFQQTDGSTWGCQIFSYVGVWCATNARKITGPLRVGLIGCPETSVTNYQYGLRNIPEVRSSHLHRGGSRKSRMHIPCATSNVIFQEKLLTSYGNGFVVCPEIFSEGSRAP